MKIMFLNAQFGLNSTKGYWEELFYWRIFSKEKHLLKILEFIKKEHNIKDFPPKKTYEARTYPPVQTVTSARPLSTVPAKPTTTQSVTPLRNTEIRPILKTVSQPIARPISPSVAVKQTLIQPPAKSPEKVSLSSLNKAPQDNKHATGENMNDLKNILAKAMGAKSKDFNLGKIDNKKDTSAPETTKKITEEPLVKKGESVNDTEEVSENVKKDLPTMPAYAGQTGEKTIKEIPEDVLKKILEEKQNGEK